jgi:hypothetical protein
MKLKASIAALFLLIGCTAILRADLAPPNGYTRISVGIILETKDDLADYRFFLVSSNLVKEILVKKDERATVGPLGGGARYSSGRIVAIPSKGLTTFGEKPVDVRLRDMEYAVAGGQIAGTITLLEHSFAREVPDAEAAGWKDAVYRLEKDAETGIKAVWVSGGANESKKGDGVAFTIVDISRPASIAEWTTIAGGVLMTLAFLSLGLWVFVRSFKKSAQ